jgi:(S)-mandelate dehydrogenase
MKHRRPINVTEYRSLARKAVPSKIFDYIEGGADDELCLRRNRDTLNNLLLYPRVLEDVSQCSISTSLFGDPVEAPILVGPTGLNGLISRNGDIALARAAQRAGIPFILSSAANSTIQEVAKITNNLWFQLYVVREDLTTSLVQRVSDAGVKVLVVTVDTPVGGKRERDIRSDFRFPLEWSIRDLANLCRYPKWSLNYIRSPRPDLVNLKGLTPFEDENKRLLLERRMDPSFNWERLRQLRDHWHGTLIVKGILAPKDAITCAEIGVDGVIISNHGGRQLDSAPSAFEVLPKLSIPPNVTVMADGGVRRGSDIVKAIGLGANAVLLGRAPLYGLASGGEEGAYKLIELLKEEIRSTLMLIGCQSIKHIKPSHVQSSAIRKSDLAD